jgi:hypothetical protein
MAVTSERIEDSAYRAGGYVQVRAEVCYELVSAEAIYSDAPEKLHRYRVLVSGQSIGEVWQASHQPFNRRGRYSYASTTVWHWSFTGNDARSSVGAHTRRAAAICLLVEAQKALSNGLADRLPAV